MTLEDFLDEWHRQANEYGGSLTQEQRDIAEQAWQIATEQEREACAKVCEKRQDIYEVNGFFREFTAARACAEAVRARGHRNAP